MATRGLLYETEADTTTTRESKVRLPRCLACQRVRTGAGTDASEIHIEFRHRVADCVLHAGVG